MSIIGCACAIIDHPDKRQKHKRNTKTPQAGGKFKQRALHLRRKRDAYRRRIMQQLIQCICCSYSGPSFKLHIADELSEHREISYHAPDYSSLGFSCDITQKMIDALHNLIQCDYLKKLRGYPIGPELRNQVRSSRSVEWSQVSCGTCSWLRLV